MPGPIRSLLISQPAPATGRSPYGDLQEKYALQIDYEPFIAIEPVTAREFRRDKVQLGDATAIILTSRTAIEHLFRITNEMRIELSDNTKYFCSTESIALYLQKFITYRKRKVFYPKDPSHDFNLLLAKGQKEKFIIVRSDITYNDVSEFLNKRGITYQDAILYKTVSADLSHYTDVKYDVLVFFSPFGIKSLLDNFPNYKQGETAIAAFGSATLQAVESAGLRLDVEAPTEKFPSMSMALEDFIKKRNT